MEASSGSFALRTLRGVGAALQRLPRSAAWIPALLWIALIWSLSDQPSSDDPQPAWLGVVGNLAHAPLFGLLALWFVLLSPRERGWPRLSGSAVLVIVGGVLGYAIVDEWHQASVAGRDASVFDVLTDVVGAACTLWIIGYVGSAGASERGLWKRLVLGVLACAAAALLASTV